MIRAIVVLVGLAFSIPAISGPVEQLRDCQEIKDKGKRLSCLDAAARTVTSADTEKQSLEMFIANAKAHAVEEFFDPDSAKFRNLVVRVNLVSKAPSRSLCGEVNGKNRNGGYVGYRRFIQTYWIDEGKFNAPDIEVPYLPRDGKDAERDVFELMWRQDCIEDKTATR